jgi:hypothetical protein
MNSNTTFILYFYCRLCFWGILNKLGCQQVLGTRFSHYYARTQGNPDITPVEFPRNPCKLLPVRNFPITEF